MEKAKIRGTRGFTIVELLIFTAIFTVSMVAFITIFVSLTRVQTQQSASIEVEQQSQFLLQQIQYYVQQSSLVDMTTDSSTTSLKLRMANPGLDPTYITLSSGTLYLQQGATGTLQSLSSGKVVISNVSFTKHSNAPAHDSVSVAMTVAYNTSNIQQAFSQLLQTSIARVSAASFDSNLIPSSTNAYNVGITGNVWSSINQVIYFNGSNVGIGQTSPAQTLDVNGGVRLYTATAQPTCASGIRGTLWDIEGASNVTDTLQLCVQLGTGAYSWAKLY